MVSTTIQIRTARFKSSNSFHYKEYICICIYHNTGHVSAIVFVVIHFPTQEYLGSNRAHVEHSSFVVQEQLFVPLPRQRQPSPSMRCEFGTHQSRPVSANAETDGRLPRGVVETCQRLDSSDPFSATCVTGTETMCRYYPYFSSSLLGWCAVRNPFTLFVYGSIVPVIDGIHFHSPFTK